MKIASVSFRLIVLVSVSALALILMFWVASDTLYDTLRDDRIAMTRNIAESARDVAKTFHERSMAGEFDEATAQKLARTAIRGMHYAGSEYMFVFSPDGTSIVHGATADREGKNFIGTTDANGYAYVKDLIAKGMAGGGHVFYLFPKSGTSNPEPKVSYVSYYAPWKWVVGTGVSLEDLEQEHGRISTWLLLSCLGGLVLTAILAFITWRGIAYPLKGLALVTKKISEGVYDSPVVGAERSDEIGALAQAMLAFQSAAKAGVQERDDHDAENVADQQKRRAELEQVAADFQSASGAMVKNVHGAAFDLKRLAAKMGELVTQASTCAGNVENASARSSSSVSTVASATEQLSSSIREISQQVQRSETVAQDAVEKASVSVSSINELSNVVGQIGEVALLIESIAKQTNLLALNATIEAARAGEAGKGFAVVANEVKNLASQTAKATNDISARILAVQTETETVARSIDQIVTTIHDLREVSGAVAAAVEEQNAATAEISKSISNAAQDTIETQGNAKTLLKISDQTGTSTNELVVSANIMAGLATELDDQVKSFVSNMRGEAAFRR